MRATEGTSAQLGREGDAGQGGAAGRSLSVRNRSRAAGSLPYLMSTGRVLPVLGVSVLFGKPFTIWSHCFQFARIVVLVFVLRMKYLS
jgi:hypothetical protein